MTPELRSGGDGRYRVGPAIICHSSSGLMQMQETHTKHPNYLGVFVILGILTVTEVIVAQTLAESIRIPILLLLAVAKGVLVALYYMHLKFDSRIFAFFFGMAIFLLAIPFVLILLLVKIPFTGTP